MTEDENFIQLRELIVSQLNVEENQVTPDASFEKDLKADSLDLVELVMTFEDHFQIEVDDTSGPDIRTVQDALDYIRENQDKD